MNLQWAAIQTRWQRIQFTRAEQQAFLEDLYSLVDDGVPVNAAIETIRDIYDDDVAAVVASDIAANIAQGQLLADGMSHWFARPIVEIIRAGENGGTLADSLQAALLSFQEYNSVIATVLHAVTYPFAVVIMALVMTVVIKDSVLESFIKIQPVADWPPIGQQLYGLATLTAHWWWLMIITVVGAALLMAQLLRQLTGPWRTAIDQFPLLSLYRQITAARFMETLGLLITNGIVLKDALAIMQRDAAPYLAWHLLMMEYNLSGGQDNIADVLDTGLLQRSDLVRLKVVAKGKGFEQALLSLGHKANKKSFAVITLTSKISGGILLAIGAILAATIVFGIYTVGSAIA